MVKVSANTAMRKELVEVAGLRPEIADAILEFRGKHGKVTSVDALEELPGVGPATLEQLRKVLDFSERSSNGSNEAVEEIGHSTGAVTERNEATAELGRLFMDLLGEQFQHNFRTALALGQAVHWDEVAQAQSDFVRVSFERMNRLNSRYLEIVQAMMEATASAGSNQAKKAA
jgi:competence ComEA-like helix-hairpin-helix protein